MTKIEFVFATPYLQPDSVAAKPKTIYLAGKNYARIEQPADLRGHKNLIIVHNRNIWEVDGIHKKGRHTISKDPNFEVHNPILGLNSPSELFAFEYGHECDFFSVTKAQSKGEKKIGDARCAVRELESGIYRIILYTHIEKGSPVLVQVFEGQETMFQIVYTSFECGLVFKPSLFKPPADVSFEEMIN